MKRSILYMEQDRFVIRHVDGTLEVRVRKIPTPESIEELKQRNRDAISREPAGTLHYAEWLKEAERRNVFLTIDEFKQIPAGETIALLDADYVLFCVSQGMEVKKNHPYDPVEFVNTVWHDSINYIKPTGDVQSVEPQYGSCCSCRKMKRTKTTRYHILMTKKSYSFVDEPRSCYHHENVAWIVNDASGDGHTRYIALDRLSAMPPFFFRDLPRGQYDFSDEPIVEYVTDPDAIPDPNDEICDLGARGDSDGNPETQ